MIILIDVRNITRLLLAYRIRFNRHPYRHLMWEASASSCVMCTTSLVTNICLVRPNEFFFGTNDPTFCCLLKPPDLET